MANKPYYQIKHDWEIEYIAKEIILIELCEKWIRQIECDFLLGFDLKDEFLKLEGIEIVGELKDRYVFALKTFKLRLRQKRQDYYKMYGQFPSARKLREVASQEKKYYGLDK